MLACLVLVACGGDDGPRPDTQPAPDVTTFEDGGFDDLPLYPGSEPVSLRSEEDGVVARSYRATGATAEQILEWYRERLPAEGWNLVGNVEKLGVGTWRGDWSDGSHRLRVSATHAETLEPSTPASDKVVSQFSLSLRPLS